MIKTPYLDMVEINIRRTLNSMTQILQVLLAQKNCSNMTRKIAQIVASYSQSGPSLLENLYTTFNDAANYYSQSNELNEKEKVNFLNCIQSLQYQISKITTKKTLLILFR